ncbi:hypothetical protein HA402_010670 [Bradysia odoriphaga]|nr:hypothetical protein HA402_010670 [Bradysia odoriphaga]
MYHGRLRSSKKRQSEEVHNNPNKRHSVHDIRKIGEFDIETWKNCFQYLDDEDLANVAYVNRTFKALAERLFHKRHKGEMRIQMNVTGWKPIACRFKNIISSLYLTGPTIPYSERILDFFGQFLTKSLKEITFGCIQMNHFKNIKFQRKFLKLESLSFVVCQLELGDITQLDLWCPNLKSLTLSACTIRNSTIFEQFIPSLEDVTLFDIFDDVTNEKLVNFFTLNPQLKRIAVDLPYQITFESLSIVNEKLMNLEKMKWRCDDFELLPNFQQQFLNLKELSFLMDFSGTYSNQLLTIVKNLPQIELIQVVNCRKNTMTNFDLVELITACTTLKTLEIFSTSLERKLEFSYDLHRQICRATANRSTINISLYFQSPFPTKRFIITKKWIKEDGRLIILAPDNLSNY